MGGGGKVGGGGEGGERAFTSLQTVPEEGEAGGCLPAATLHY